MKILFCAYDRPGHIATGPNAWIQRLIPDLINKYGIDITTLFLHHGKKEECPTIAFFMNEELPISTINVEKIRYNEEQVKRILRLIIELKIQVLVANLVIPAFYAAKYLKESNIPVVTVLHSNDNFYKQVVNKFVNHDNSNQTTVSVSKYINSFVDKQKKGDHLVIPCGTPMTNLKATPPSKGLKIIYAGRIEIEAKQIFLLTKAFISASNTLPGLEFNIYGSGSQEKNTKSLIDASGVPSVHFKGAVAPSEIQEVMSHHHIFTLMSDYEGMPIALMEAMACGLVPICLSENSGVNEIIKNGINGFIVNDRDLDYQEKLRLLQQNTDLWSIMSQNAVKTIKENYSTEITHKKWADLLISLLENKISSPIMPRKIILDGDPLTQEINRKPNLLIRLKTNSKNQWMKFRLAVRPRARLRKLLS